MSSTRSHGAPITPAKLLLATGALLALFAAHQGCGGEAIVDAVASGGGNASSSSTSGTTNPLCATPDPVGSLGACTSSGGAFGPGSCASFACDEAGNVWQSSCDDNSCDCYHNGELRCTCLTEGSADLCLASVPSCCPSPFPD